MHTLSEIARAADRVTFKGLTLVYVARIPMNASWRISWQNVDDDARLVMINVDVDSLTLRQAENSIREALNTAWLDFCRPRCPKCDTAL